MKISALKFAALLYLGLNASFAMASSGSRGDKVEPITLKVVCLPTTEPQYAVRGQDEIIVTPISYAKQVLKEPVIGLFSSNHNMENLVKAGDYNLPPVRFTFLPTPDNIRLLGDELSRAHEMNKAITSLLRNLSK